MSRNDKRNSNNDKIKQLLTDSSMQNSNFTEKDVSFTDSNVNISRSINTTDFNDKNSIIKIIQLYKSKIQETNELIKFNEENYEEEIQTLKNKISEFIKENISLKSNNEKLLMENNIKEKEIEEYKNIIKKYQQLNSTKNDIKDNNKNIIDNSILIKENENLFYQSKYEKLKTENLIALYDLQREQTEHQSTKKALNYYKELILNKDKNIQKKNYKIIYLQKKIKALKTSINNKTKNVTENLNNQPIKETHFKNNSEILNNNPNNNFLRHINKLLGENHYLRLELQKIKNQLYDTNVQIQIYESQEENHLKLKQTLFEYQESISDIINQKKLLIKYINEQIESLEILNKTSNNKFQYINNVINDKFSLNDVYFILKEIFNKISSLCYIIDLSKEKEKYYEKELKDIQIEKKICQDQIYEKQCDIEAYKETIKSYEKTIKQLTDEKKNLNNIINSNKHKKSKKK